jgi:serine/threonine protein kinase
MAKILDDQYEIIKELNKGAFGKIFLGKNISNKETVAIKREKYVSKRPIKIDIEYRLYKRLNRKNPNFGVPKIYHYIKNNDYHYMVMELLGDNLETVFEKCHGKFTLQTILCIAIQGLVLLEQFHEFGYAHRDIKPANFVLGIKDTTQLYLIDFGLARRWEKIPKINKRKHSMVGTARYASINAHLGINELCARDDLISFGYMLIFFLKGKLPWQGLKGKNDKDQMDQIILCKMKNKTNICDDTYKQFQDYFNYCYGLKYGETPNYVYLRSLFTALRNEKKLEKFFEWVKT